MNTIQYVALALFVALGSIGAVVLGTAIGFAIGAML